MWMALSGFKSNQEIFSNPWAFPTHWSFSNYYAAWNHGLFRNLVNSVIVAVGSVVLVTLLASWAAYGLTRVQMPFSTPITMMILGGIMVAPTAALIPLFKLLQTLHLYDTYWALIVLYAAFRMPFTTFLIRSYMVGLPAEVNQAATIDGANSWQIFWRVVLPMSRPILVSAALLQGLFSWNEFVFALVFIDNAHLKTLPVGLMDFQSTLLTNWPVLFAGLTIAALPMILIFLIGQRQFVRGLTEGFGK
jgi:raffinose/stachyose/melibiose transport system permease protein